MSLLRVCNCDELEIQIKELKLKNEVLQSQVLELTQQLIMYKDITSNTGVLKSLIVSQQETQIENDDNKVFEKLPSIIDSEVAEISNKLTVSVLKNGISGICFAFKDYIETRVVLTNASSGNFAFRYNSKVVMDVKSALLSQIIVRNISAKVLELASKVTEEFADFAEQNEGANTDSHVKIIKQLNWIKKNKHELCKTTFTKCIKKIVKTKSAYIASIKAK
jgi:hypothetical protein